MKKISEVQKRNIQRKRRVKGKIFRGGISAPRLSVFKSNKHIFVQVIDDMKRVTLASAGDNEIKGDKQRMELASELGKLIAKKATEKKVKKVIFDRGRYNYHGIVKAIADGAREGGLKF